MIQVEMKQTFKAIAEAALQKIGAENIQAKVERAMKFAVAQPPVQINLDGREILAVAVDIATVFSPEDSYRKIEFNGSIVTVEIYRAISVVITGEDVLLCKSICDVVPGSTYQDARFINARYGTTSVEMLTEAYVS